MIHQYARSLPIQKQPIGTSARMPCKKNRTAQWYMSSALSHFYTLCLLPWMAVCRVSKCWLCWSWRPQRDKCYGEWLIEIQSTLQNDLFDIPSRKLLFVELIIHSCIHEKNTIFESCRIQKQNKLSYNDWIQVSVKNLLSQKFDSVEW